MRKRMGIGGPKFHFYFIYFYLLFILLTGISEIKDI